VNSDKSLSVPEWLFVVGMCGFLLFAAVSANHNKKILSPSNLPQIEVFITGAVAEEKRVSLPYGAKVVDALACVEPLSCAALDHLFYNAALSNEQVVVVPKQGMISIYITGAVVDEKVIYFPEGSRFPALLKRSELFLPQADLRFLKRKRRVLKDGEHVIIPHKTNALY
jgi:hypothetical protein